MNKLYDIKISGSAPVLYPADTLFGLLWYSQDEALEIPKRYPYKGEWGGCLSTCLMLCDKYPMPYQLNLAWLSIVEKTFYAIEEYLPRKVMGEFWESKKNEHGEFIFSHIIVGMAPYGKVALWFYGEHKSSLLAWFYADEVEISMVDFVPNNPRLTKEELCNIYINNDPRVKENLEKNGLPPHNLFDKYMQQFTYRYVLLFEKWEEDKEDWKAYEDGETVPEFDYIEEALYDGTHDKLHDGGLLKYHEAGKPKKLAMKWHMQKSEYSAYFWFDDRQICAVYDKFYGAHRDTKTDFRIQVDAEKRQYRLSLYRYGLKEPVRIPEGAYQYIVFKNKFEHCRSDNYSQERGAWIW